MWQYQALVVAHLLCAILWLGPDLVSWYVAWILRRPRFDTPTRLAVAEVLRVLDQYSRTATILLIPTGIGLLRVSGYGLHNVPVELLWLAACVCFLWAIASFWITGLQKSWKGMRPFFLADQGLRLAVAVAALIALGTSFGGGDTVSGDWLIVKIAIFAAIMLSAIVAFTLPNPFIILGEIATDGSTDDRETRFRTSLDRIMGIVVVINTSLIAVIIMAVIRV